MALFFLQQERILRQPVQFWIGCEADDAISEEFRLARNDVEDQLLLVFRDKAYGNGVEKWAVIPILMSVQDASFPEFKKYHKKRRVVELRLKGDCEAFRQADSNAQRRMILDLVVRSVEEARTMRIPAFDLDLFQAELQAFAAQQAWV